MTTFVVGSAYLILGLFEHVRLKPGALPAVVLVMAAVGLGLDLRNERTGRFLRIAAAASIVLSLLGAFAIASTVPLARGHPSFDDWLLGMEIFAPLALTGSIISRWCARREMRKRFDQGTARFSPEDIKRREGLIEEFRHENEN